jgi:hypothetical protein
VPTREQLTSDVLMRQALGDSLLSNHRLRILGGLAVLLPVLLPAKRDVTSTVRMTKTTCLLKRNRAKVVGGGYHALGGMTRRT